MTVRCSGEGVREGKPARGENGKRPARRPNGHKSTVARKSGNHESPKERNPERIAKSGVVATTRSIRHCPVERQKYGFLFSDSEASQSVEQRRGTRTSPNCLGEPLAGARMRLCRSLSGSSDGGQYKPGMFVRHFLLSLSAFRPFGFS